MGIFWFGCTDRVILGGDDQQHFSAVLEAGSVSPELAQVDDAALSQPRRQPGRSRDILVLAGKSSTPMDGNVLLGCCPGSVQPQDPLCAHRLCQHCCRSQRWLLLVMTYSLLEAGFYF